VVEDDVVVRQTVSMLLSDNGYRVSTAGNGFDALLRLQEEVPDVMVTDLNMPEMSGFELLSVVRRRFPSIVAIATSAAYSSASVPPGVIADAFYAKGKVSSGTLLEIITAAIKKGPLGHDRTTAPVWIPRNGRDHNGKPYVVLTCTECLRSFPFTVAHEPTAEVLKTQCIYCPHEVSYIIDFSRGLNSPLKRAAWKAQFLEGQSDFRLPGTRLRESIPDRVAEIAKEMAKPVKATSARRNDRYNR
jgi:CheY-like chemotaxis protein